jgi:DNA-binding NtrC family response regulator
VAKTILVVEDEYLIAMDLEMILRRHGWLVLGPVSTVAEALLLLEADQPSVAILDVTLRDGVVSPVARALQDLDVPFILSSAYERPETIGGDVLAGATNVGKPIDERRLLGALELVAGP